MVTHLPGGLALATFLLIWPSSLEDIYNQSPGHDRILSEAQEWARDLLVAQTKTFLPSEVDHPSSRL